MALLTSLISEHSLAVTTKLHIYLRMKIAIVGEISLYIQNVPRGIVNILVGHSGGHSNKKIIYVHVTYSERFPR
jgi:hypothetical protein